MGRALSRDLRDRVVAAVDGGVSCRRAAEPFGVSAASAIRWRQLALVHGTPAAKPQGGDRRTAKIEDHADFILEAIEREPDPTLGPDVASHGFYCLPRVTAQHRRNRPFMLLVRNGQPSCRLELTLQLRFWMMPEPMGDHGLEVMDVRGIDRDDAGALGIIAT